MINMRYEISRLQFPQGPEGQRLILIIGLFDAVLVVPLEYLVIGIAKNFQVFVYKAFMDRGGYRLEMNLFFQIVENGIKPLELFRVFREKMNFETLPFPAFLNLSSADRTGG